MKYFGNFRPRPLLATAFGAALLLCGAFELLFQSQAHAQEKPTQKASDSVDTPTLSERLPDQSHAMEDAGYHFENLWFAGDKQNWPLASYYLRKTQAYLNLAVQIKPIRKTESGAEVNLKGIWDAVNNSFLTEVGKAIEDKDPVKFKTAYRQTIEGCIACHTACEKSYLRVQVPSAPSVTIINFNPSATGPE
jgi:hypothetical protein